MAYLDVPAATIYHEVVGQGPMLLCITGALGNVEPFKGLAECLKSHFTVVMYGRGFSRSHLSTTEPQDYDHRIETDADDAAALIKFLSPKAPATVLASSVGGLVGLELLIRHADLIQTLILHEPHISTLLPDHKEIAAKVHNMYTVYRQYGMPPALRLFGDITGIGPAEAPFLMEAFNPKNGPYIFSDAQYWFERELTSYPINQHFDIAVVKKLKGKLVLGVGEYSDPDALHCRANVVLSKALGLDLARFHGGHLGLALHPQEFAQKLVEVVKARN